MNQNEIIKKVKFKVVGEDKVCPNCGLVIESKYKHAFENEWCPDCGLNLDIIKIEQGKSS